MGFRDRWEICSQCGTRFVFTVELQRHQVADGKSLEEILLCPTCAPRAENGLPRPVPQMQLDPLTGNWVGCIKWFDLEKGYGFIDRGDGSDIFFHKTAVVGVAHAFVENASVTYAVEETLRGPQAVEVQLFNS